MKRVVIYTIALEGGCYYVGLSEQIMKRIEQHEIGKGSVWTRLHRPIGIVECQTRDVHDLKEAEQFEDITTVEMMVKYGWRNVRGGHFCQRDESATEADLRSYGVWDIVFQRKLLGAVTNDSWSVAIEKILALAKQYHLDGCDPQLREPLLASFLGLKRYSEWSEDFAPALDCAFWDRKGVLPILLSIRDGTPIGSGLQDVFAVLCAALQRGKSGKRPLNRLFLFSWKTFMPNALPHQQEKVDHMVENIDSFGEQDNRYNAFATIAFPETRRLLR